MLSHGHISIAYMSESVHRGGWTKGVGKGNGGTEKGEEGDKRMGWKVKK